MDFFLINVNTEKHFGCMKLIKRVVFIFSFFIFCSDFKFNSFRFIWIWSIRVLILYCVYFHREHEILVQFIHTKRKWPLDNPIKIFWNIWRLWYLHNRYDCQISSLGLIVLIVLDDKRDERYVLNYFFVIGAKSNNLTEYDISKVRLFYTYHKTAIISFYDKWRQNEKKWIMLGFYSTLSDYGCLQQIFLLDVSSFRFRKWFNEFKSIR